MPTTNSTAGGAADSRGGRCCSVATAEEVRDARGTVTGDVSDMVKRVEQLQEMVRQRKTNDSEVQCTLKTMNEQQRSMMGKIGKQLFMDETDQLTPNEAGHTDLAGIGNVGRAPVHM